ncbi:MAG: hypothetical protein ABSD38_23965 [Syntrophorhabdales bacterium]|jgi:hypothetical protein
MFTQKLGKYIVTNPKENLVVPKWGGNLSQERSTRMMYLDSEVIKGAFYVECVWFWPTEQKDTSSPDPHTHEWDEVIAFFGTDPNNLHDLGAEIELFIDGEQNLINETFLAFIPAGIVHCPLNILSITKPVFHFAVGQGKQYF